MSAEGNAKATSESLGVRIDGKAVADALRAKVAEAAAALSVKPTLVVLLVGDRQDSATYVRMKEVSTWGKGLVQRLTKFVIAAGSSRVRRGVPS